MVSKSRSLLLAASLLAVSMAAATAQQSNSTDNQDSNKPAYQPRPSGNYSSSAMNTTTPGATGKTIVPGTTSTQAGSAAATANQKTGTEATGGK